MNKSRRRQKSWQSVLIIFILMFENKFVKTLPLTMGLGGNLNLQPTHEFSNFAFSLNFQDQPGRPIRGESFHKHRRLRRGQFIEVDVKHSKKKEIPGVRHMFCSGYYCAFQYASKSK